MQKKAAKKSWQMNNLTPGTEIDDVKWFERLKIKKRSRNKFIKHAKRELERLIAES